MRQKPTQQVADRCACAPAGDTTADKLHFDWNTKGNGKLLPARVFDDGDRALPCVEPRNPASRDPDPVPRTSKEGPVNYRMSGEYVVVSPVPPISCSATASKVAVLWPRHGSSAQRHRPAPL